MAKSRIGAVLFQIFFALCLSEKIVSAENNCRIISDRYDRAAMYSRSFFGGETYRWPNAEVPYIMDNNFDEEDRDLIYTSMEHISYHSCVKFIPKTNQTHYLKIISKQGSRCAAHSGYSKWRWESYVHLGKNGCMVKGIIVHELLHILGMTHEHNRYDRDEYIKINWENIKQGAYGNFFKYYGDNETNTLPHCRTVSIDNYDNCNCGKRSTTYGLPYDYGSIMHYGLEDYSKNGNQTITLKKPTTLEIPNRKEMTDLDAQKTRAAYGCKNFIYQITTSTSTTTTTTTTTKIIGCSDVYDYCEKYKFWCRHNSVFKTYCQKTCTNCAHVFVG